VPIARGQHLFPCRTQQLSLGAVTILGVHPWENSTVPNYTKSLLTGAFCLCNGGRLNKFLLYYMLWYIIQYNMPRPERPQEENAPAKPEFELDPKGVDLVAEAAISKFVEAAEVDSPGFSADREMRAHNMMAAGHLRIHGGIMASTLDLVAKRTDSKPWEEFLKAQAAERRAAAREASTGDSS
jgi:hypothetical protein